MMRNIIHLIGNNRYNKNKIQNNEKLESVYTCVYPSDKCGNKCDEKLVLPHYLHNKDLFEFDERIFEMMDVFESFKSEKIAEICKIYMKSIYNSLYHIINVKTSSVIITYHKYNKQCILCRYGGKIKGSTVLK
tara:strand:- start:19 stop:417 length:399 start_codon:yes stop_codon:yes gene_type:complete